MKTRNILIVMLIGVVVGAFAGEGVQFLGTWILDESKLADTGGPQMESTKIIVKQASESLSTERFMSNPMMGDFSVTETVTLDGKECVSDLEWGEGTRTTTAVWSEDMKVLTLKSLFKMSWEGEAMEMGATEIWSLEEKNVLKIDAIRDSPMGVIQSVIYYNKGK